MFVAEILLFALQTTHQISRVTPQGYFAGEMRFADADGDGDQDLYVGVYSGGVRYIDIYYQDQNLFGATPAQHITVPSSVVAWSTGELLPQNKGQELIWTAARGIYVRNSAGRPQLLARESLLLDVPNTFSALTIDWAADIDNDGLAEIVLVTSSGYKIIQHDGTLVGSIEVEPAQSWAPIAASNLFDGRVRPKLSSQELSTLFVPNEEVGVVKTPPALYSSLSLPTPVWHDVNGDSLLDLSYNRNDKLHIHLQSADGKFLSQADRVFELPDSSKSKYEQLEWLNADGTGSADLLLVRSSEDVLSQTRPWQVRLYLNAWGLQSLEEADSLYKVQSTALKVALLDLNGNSKPDICMSNWSLDLGLLGRGSPQLKHTASAFLDTEDGWQVRPAFAEKRSINVDEIDSFVSTDSFSRDITGNGHPDFLEISENGSLRVRQFELSEGAISIANSNAIDLPLQALAAEVEVNRLNADKLGDIVIKRPQSIEIYMSVTND